MKIPSLKIKVLRMIHRFVYELACLNPNEDQMAKFDKRFKATFYVADEDLGTAISGIIRFVEDET